MTFDEWWKEYCKISSLNKEYLSFLDVDILKEEFKLAFEHKLTDPKLCKYKITMTAPSHQGGQNENRSS